VIAGQAFQDFKDAMCITQIVTLSNFTKNFFWECDASIKGFGAILLQASRSLSFSCKNLLERYSGKSTYEKQNVDHFACGEYLASLPASEMIPN
jgi:hypothetical protein